MPATVEAKVIADNYAETGGPAAASALIQNAFPEGNPIYSIRHLVTNPCSTGNAANRVSWFSFGVTTASHLTSVTLSYDSKCTAKGAGDGALSLILVKPDASEVTLSTRTVTAVDASWVSSGTITITSNFTADGTYKLVIRWTGVTANTTYTIFVDNVSVSFADADLTQAFISKFDNNTFTIIIWDAEATTGNPQGCGSVSYATGSTQVIEAAYFTKTGTVGVATVRFESKCTSFGGTDATVRAILVKPDASEVTLATRTVTAIDAGWVNSDATISTSHFTQNGTYKLRLETTGTAAMASTGVFLMDNVGLQLGPAPSSAPAESPALALQRGTNQSLMGLFCD